MYPECTRTVGCYMFNTIAYPKHSMSDVNIQEMLSQIKLKKHNF